MDDITWIVWVRVGRVVCTADCLVESWWWEPVDVVFPEKENFDVLEDYIDTRYGRGHEVLTYIGPEYCNSLGIPEEWCTGEDD